MIYETLFACLQEKEYIANGFKKKKVLLLARLPNIRQGWLQKVSVKYQVLITMIIVLFMLFFGIIAMHNLDLEELYVKTAFLHGDLEEEIYMDQPEGFIVPGKENFVCKLKKSLYGLKQSPRQWYKKFNSFMVSNDPYMIVVYILNLLMGHLYTYYMLIAAKSKVDIANLKAQLSSEFEMKDLGAAKKILGMEISRDRNSVLLFLSQHSYIQKVLHRFNMHEAKPCPRTDSDFEYMSKVPYSSAIGSLMYVMVCSRPDLSYAMSLVSRYMANRGKEHWNAVNWIFRYLRGTSYTYLQFGRTRERLVGYVDSDHAADLDKKR
ncbi:hypothetical protein U9M48_000876 [Paspalum notatum var. saurae]|uniref:Reverse transcriptase Ty1/copia-type domain-containing protein n=1 Tax=Paspalum notatum var. saurae TaxID=547442 RepID=A0AAQ3PKY3_PASNO